MSKKDMKIQRQKLYVMGSVASIIILLIDAWFVDRVVGGYISDVSDVNLGGTEMMLIIASLVYNAISLSRLKAGEKIVPIIAILITLIVAINVWIAMFLHFGV